MRRTTASAPQCSPCTRWRRCRPRSPWGTPHRWSWVPRRSPPGRRRRTSWPGSASWSPRRLRTGWRTSRTGSRWGRARTRRRCRSPSGRRGTRPLVNGWKRHAIIRTLDQPLQLWSAGARAQGRSGYTTAHMGMPPRRSPTQHHVTAPCCKKGQVFSRVCKCMSSKHSPQALLLSLNPLTQYEQLVSDVHAAQLCGQAVQTPLASKVFAGHAATAKLSRLKRVGR